jgi:hypothetical protein
MNLDPKEAGLPLEEERAVSFKISTDVVIPERTL